MVSPNADYVGRYRGRVGWPHYATTEIEMREALRQIPAVGGLYTALDVLDGLIEINDALEDRLAPNGRSEP